MLLRAGDRLLRAAGASSSEHPDGDAAGRPAQDRRVARPVDRCCSSLLATGGFWFAAARSRASCSTTRARAPTARSACASASGLPCHRRCWRLCRNRCSTRSTRERRGACHRDVGVGAALLSFGDARAPRAPAMAERLANRLKERTRRARPRPRPSSPSTVGVTPQDRQHRRKRRVHPLGDHSRSSSPQALELSASSSCSGSSADLADLADQVALGFAMSARCMPQPGRNMPSTPTSPPIRSVRLSLGIGVGADRKIAARAVVDASCRDQPFGAHVGRRRRALARPLDRAAGHRIASSA